MEAALEVLLFVLAERELESVGEAETFYKSERQKWSERLRHALNSLVTDPSGVELTSDLAAHPSALVRQLRSCLHRCMMDDNLERKTKGDRIRYLCG